MKAVKKDLFLYYSLQMRVLLWWQGTCGIFLFELVDLGIEQFPLLATGLQITTTGLKAASAGNTCPSVGSKLPLLWVLANTAKCKRTKASQSKRRVTGSCFWPAVQFLFCLQSCISMDCCYAGQFARYSVDKLWNQVTDNILGMFGNARCSKDLQISEKMDCWGFFFFNWHFL